MAGRRRGSWGGSYRADGSSSPSWVNETGAAVIAQNAFKVVCAV